MKRLQLAQKEPQRQRWGYRFLKKHEIEWLTSRSRLREHTALSLADRVEDFKRTFPSAHMNRTLLRQIYRKFHIKKKR